MPLPERTRHIGEAGPGTALLACSCAGLSYKLVIRDDGADPYHVGTEADARWNQVQEGLLRLVRPGETMLDLGANIGVVAMPLAAHGAKVIAYEVLAENRRFLDAAIDANGLRDRVAVRPVAVWEATTRLAFTGGSAWGRVVPGGPVTREAVTHDAVAVDNDLPAGTMIAAVKIDVEGAELQALGGMRRLIADQSPHIVYESNSLELGRLGTSVSALEDALRGHGYAIYRMFGRNRLLDTGHIPQECGVADCLATRLTPAGLAGLGFRVGRLGARHISRHILGWEGDRWPDHLHLLAVHDRLPAGVRLDPRVAARVRSWRAAYRDHPERDVVAAGAA